MCVGHKFKSYSYARDYLDEAKNAIIIRQYQKALNRLELAGKEIQDQKESLRKFVLKELQNKKDNGAEPVVDNLEDSSPIIDCGS